jgi:ABC-type branched-subunit amino acid transport system substrate-binding protein
MAVFVAKFLPNVKSVAVVHGDDPAATFAAQNLFKPLAAKLGLTNVTLVPVSDTAQSAEVQQQIQNAGADKADVLVPLVTVQLCSAVYDALQSLGTNPTVVTSGLCYGTPVTKHMKDIGSKDQVPNNWYYGDYGYSYFSPDVASGMTTYLAKVHQYGGPNVEYTGFAGPTFANLLTAVQLYNKIGVDKVTVTNLSSAVTNFKGPMMLVVGPMNCGHFPNPLFKSLCGSQMGVQQYKNPNWVPTMNGLSNPPNPIDVSKY